MSKITLKADELKVAKISVNFLSNPVRVHSLFALVDTVTGRTVAWSEGEGGLWSNETMAKLRELCILMEEDAIKHISSDQGFIPSQHPTARVPAGGIAEHLSDGDADAPSV